MSTPATAPSMLSASTSRREVGQQSYRIVTDVFGDAIYGFNHLAQQVLIHTPRHWKSSLFNWSNLAVLCFKDTDA